MVNRRRLFGFSPLRSALKNEQGLNLIEVLLAMGILGTVAVAFLLSMSTSSKAVVFNNIQISAESLAKSQMESIRRQDYRVDMLYTGLDQLPPGYGIDITRSVRMNPRGDTPNNDDGLQKIVIDVTRGGETVFTLEGYKRFVGH